MISKEVIIQIRKAKLRKEIESAIKVIQSGVEPIKILDSILHSSFNLLKESISNNNPKLNSEEISEKIRKKLYVYSKLKSLKG